MGEKVFSAKANWKNIWQLLRNIIYGGYILRVFLMHANFEKFIKYPVDTVSAFEHERLKFI